MTVETSLIRRLLLVASLLVLQACAGPARDGASVQQSGTKVVPPAAGINNPTPTPIGALTIARYGADSGTLPSGGAVTPQIRLMQTPLPVVIPYGPPDIAPTRVLPLYAPSASQQPAESYSDAVGRAAFGGLLGGVLGAQVGSGTGRHVAAGVGAATGAMIGLGQSDNPCAGVNGGTIAGATIGGVVGNQIGSGSGRSAATAIGAVVGALAGTRAGSSAQNCR